FRPPRRRRSRPGARRGAPSRGCGSQAAILTLQLFCSSFVVGSWSTNDQPRTTNNELGGLMRRSAIAFAIVLLAITASAAEIEETSDRTYDVHPGAMLSLANTNGRITVHAWDQPRVRVHADKRVHGFGDAAKQAMAELKVEVTPSAGGLRVVTRHPNRDGGGLFDWMFGNNVNASVSYDITVPRSMNLDLDNTNGAIEVNDVRGSHKIGTTNGHIALARCGGAVEAETTNGGIRAELLDVTPGKAVRLETTNGRISLVAPPSLAAEIDAANSNGSINTEIPVTSTRMSRHALRGTINGGGPEGRLPTTNRSIEIPAPPAGGAL